ncbi:DUF2871 family protein [Helcococcus kunzii]|uniref:DUF2871 family protein n=2 Tax=Helcococcus kunzii TaxID=40091 RepID=UPI0038A5FBA8
MAGLFESIFDVMYLVLVISLGIKILFIKEKGAKTFGLMAVLLGVGDSFHLVPRIMAHMTENGMERFVSILSWGKMVTFITMTVFYLLYYFYYKRETNKNNKGMDILMYALFAARVILTLLPQNNWGSAEPNLTWDIIRNVPFTIMGVILMVLSYKENKLFKKFSILIFLSFLFYLPVVLFADKYPLVGMFMLPKTVAYFLLAYFGYKKYKSEFSGMDILEFSYISLIFGLAAGVFFREFTKYFKFNEYSMLSVLHTHTLVLGFILGMIIFLLISSLGKKDISKYKIPVNHWIFGMLFSITMMFIRGIYQVIGNGAELFNNAMFSGLAGLGHIALSVGLIWIMLLLISDFRIVKNK